MAWEVDEILAKIDRIAELKAIGLNTPRMFFCPHHPKEIDINRTMAWAEQIHKKEPDQIFNIRTYKRYQKTETVGTTHFVDIEFQFLRDILINASNNFYCMVDAETPNNGRWAGNIIINTNAFNRPITYYVEYCTKPERAMVRNADKHKSGNIHNLPTLGTPLAMIVKEALKFPKKDVILEWTLFNGPAGEHRTPLVFWEYRKQ
jgi:hypothetical protein